MNKNTFLTSKSNWSPVVYLEIDARPFQNRGAIR